MTLTGARFAWLIAIERLSDLFLLIRRSGWTFKIRTRNLADLSILRELDIHLDVRTLPVDVTIPSVAHTPLWSPPSGANSLSNSF